MVDGDFRELIKDATACTLTLSTIGVLDAVLLNLTWPDYRTYNPVTQHKEQFGSSIELDVHKTWSKPIKPSRF